MDSVLSETLGALSRGFASTGDVAVDADAFLRYHGLDHTAAHSARVAQEAERLALRFGASPDHARAAGWLHDISAVISTGDRVHAAHSLGIAVLAEEARAPMILHQKLSAALAEALFDLTDPLVLDAIRCHTTLRARASRLDKVLFVADKVAWDQAGTPPYLDGLREALDASLDRAALSYIEYLWQRRDTLLVVHPWLVDAYHDLRTQASAPVE